MKNILVLLLILCFSSCSTEEPKAHYNAQRLTFNVYDQTLDTLLEVVAKRYSLGLDFDVDVNPEKYSLSILNASVNDVLKKLSYDTGYFMKVVNGEILVQNDIHDESQTEISLKLNDNLWKDIQSGAEGAKVTETSVKNFFGPLFSGVSVINTSSSQRTIKIRLPKEDVPFIKKSLLYLNYLEHKRNPVITVFLVEKTHAQKFLKSPQSKVAKFAWKLNAGDNINLINNGDKIELESQLLSLDSNISQTEVFVKLKYNTHQAEHNFNFSKSPIQSINFSEKLSLIVKADWYIEGKKVSDENLSSKSISSYRKGYSDRIHKILDSTRTIKPGKTSFTELATIINSEDFNCRLVSFTSSQDSDIDKYFVNLNEDNYTVQKLLEASSKGSSAHFFIDEFGVLIDCQGSISDSRDIAWRILPEPLGSSFHSFNSGSYSVKKEGLSGPIVFLPSANALIGLSNSNIIKD